MDTIDFRSIAQELRVVVARLSQGGWRPLVGWGGAFLFAKLYYFAFVEAPIRGLPLSDGYFGALNFAFGLYVTTFLARGVEKALDARNPRRPAPTAPRSGPINEHGGAREADAAGDEFRSALPLPM